MKLLILAVAALSLGVVVHGTDVDKTCLECLCEGSTSGCDRNAGCDSYGYCGPFRISKHYWEEAGSFEQDFEKCAKNYECAERTVKEYMQKYGKDCDGDGDVDCLDYALIHHKGRNGCPYPDYKSDSLYKFVDDCLKKKSPQSQTSSSSSSQQNLPDVGEHVSQAHKDIDQGAQKVGESAQSELKDLRDRTEQVGESAQRRAENVGEGIKDSASQAKENIKEKWDQAKEGAKDKLQGAKEGIQDTARSVQEKFQGTSSQGQDTFRKEKDELASQLKSKLPDEHDQSSLISGEKSHQSLPMTEADQRSKDSGSSSSVSDMIKSRRKRGLFGF